MRRTSSQHRQGSLATTTSPFSVTSTSLGVLVQCRSLVVGLGTGIFAVARTDPGCCLRRILATRHFAGSYMVNALELPSEDVAIALGHTDGGELVRRLYGHRDRDRALDRVAAAYERTASHTQLRLV
jgi:hypothetical protein